MPRDIDPAPDHGERNEVEIAEHVDADADEREREQRHQLVSSGEAIVRVVERLPDPQIEAEQLPRQGTVVNNILMIVNQSDPQQARQLRELGQQVDILRQQVQAIHDGPVVGGIRIKYVLIACGILGGIGSAMGIIFSLKNNVGTLAPFRASMPSAPANAALGDATDVEKVRSFWLRRSEQEFWDSLADFVEREAPRSFQEQLFFNQQTLDIANPMLTQTWTWNSVADRLALLQQLSEMIQSQGLSQMYRSLPKMTYGDQNVSFPRAVAAELASLALTQWWVNYGALVPEIS